MLPIAPGIYAALTAVELGITTFANIWPVIQGAYSQGRDLTEDEMVQLDLRRDEVHNRVQKAIEDKRRREQGN